MKQPLISIITVVYNGVSTLEASIDSVISQTWPHVEFIVVDGGSTDGTLQLIERHKSEIANYVSEPDKGVYDAMNKGIRMAKGEWVYFLGSDDTFLHAKVLQEFFAADLEDVDLAYGDVYSQDYKGRYDGEFTYPKLLSRNISHQAAFYRRSLFDRLGGYDLRYRMHADWDFNLRCFSSPGVRTKFTGVLVANFGVGGVSAGHDVPFLRERLLPARLKELKQDPSHPLRRIKQFDEWWRLLRNANITNEKQWEGCIVVDPLPAAIRRMIRFQRPIPGTLLRVGPLSKLLMGICYATSRLLGVL